MKSRKINIIIFIGIMTMLCSIFVGCKDDEVDPLANATINNTNNSVEYVMPMEETSQEDISK